MGFGKTLTSVQFTPYWLPKKNKQQQHKIVNNFKLPENSNYTDDRHVAVFRLISSEIILSW